MNLTTLVRMCQPVSRSAGLAPGPCGSPHRQSSPIPRPLKCCVMQLYHSYTRTAILAVALGLRRGDTGLPGGAEALQAAAHPPVHTLYGASRPCSALEKSVPCSGGGAVGGETQQQMAARVSQGIASVCPPWGLTQGLSHLGVCSGDVLTGGDLGRAVRMPSLPRGFQGFLHLSLLPVTLNFLFLTKPYFNMTIHLR